MTKAEIQQEAIDALEKDKRLIVEFATGVGKSKVAIDFLKKYKEFKVLLVVAEILHKNNWEKEFQKWHAVKIFKNITIECYASLHKYENTEWDLIILDEAHHIGSDLRMQYLSTIKSKYVLCLSATFPKRSLLFPLQSIFGKFSIKTMGLQKAIDNDILPEPTIFTIPLELPKRGETEQFVEEWGKDGHKIEVVADYRTRWVYKKNKKTYPNVKMTVRCTPYQKYLYLCEQFDYWKRISAIKGSEFTRNKQMRYGTERKEFLGLLKTNLVPALLERLNGKRYMCFCTNILQCETLGGNDCIHSNKKGNDEIVDKFNNLETNRLFVVFKGIEGMNFNQIDAGIIIQLDGSDTKVKQKFGRILRAEDPELYIFYYKNTRDEEFLKGALEGINKQYIKELNYDELVAKN